MARCPDTITPNMTIEQLEGLISKCENQLEIPKNTFNIETFPSYHTAIEAIDQAIQNKKSAQFIPDFQGKTMLFQDTVGKVQASFIANGRPYPHLYKHEMFGCKPNIIKEDFVRRIGIRIPIKYTKGRVEKTFWVKATPHSTFYYAELTSKKGGDYCTAPKKGRLNKKVLYSYGKKHPLSLSQHPTNSSIWYNNDVLPFTNSKSIAIFVDENIYLVEK
jgi:hypothetical protein